MSVPAFDAVGLEITAVECEDSDRFELLRRAHERCVCKVHRMVRVLLHELEYSLQRGGARKPNTEPPSQDEVPEPVAALARW